VCGEENNVSIKAMPYTPGCLLQNEVVVQ